MSSPGPGTLAPDIQAHQRKATLPLERILLLCTYAALETSEVKGASGKGILTDLVSLAQY